MSVWKNCNVNENKFINCDSPEVAYLLGFIYGDGYLYHKDGTNQHTIRIECVKEDLLTLENVFFSVGKWTKYYLYRKNRKPALGFTTCNKKLFKYLESKGYTNKSSKPHIILNDMKDDFKKYWVRGFFDADGCIYVKGRIHQVTFSSSYNQDWSILEKYFNEIGIKSSIKKCLTKTGNHSYLRFCSKKSVNIFFNLIYDDLEFGLKRKKDKFLNIVGR